MSVGKYVSLKLCGVDVCMLFPGLNVLHLIEKKSERLSCLVSRIALYFQCNCNEHSSSEKEEEFHSWSCWQ